MSNKRNGTAKPKPCKLRVQYWRETLGSVVLEPAFLDVTEVSFTGDHAELWRGVDIILRVKRQHLNWVRPKPKGSK